MRKANSKAWLDKLLYLPLLALWLTPGQAQDDASPSQFRVMPYLWAAQFDGTVGAATGGGGDRIDVTAGFDELELAGAMIFGEWRKGRWSLLGDWAYARVSSNASPERGLLYSEAKATVRGHVLQAALGYSLYQQNDVLIDLFAGPRYINIDIALDLAAGQFLPATEAGADDAWFDGVVGLRGELPLAERWRLGWYTDIGAGGSDLTWQVSASLAYQFGWGSLVGGWRHLYVDYEKADIRLDAALTGPFIGADFRF